MRNELTYIQLIENYLMNKLSSSDKQEFEARLKTDNQLVQDVEKQKLVMEGAKRMGLKKSAKKGFKKFKTVKNIKYIATTIAVLGAAALLYYTISNTEAKTNTPETLLPEQGFVINNTADTVIETENGMILVIPKNAFVFENGDAVAGNVDFEVKEAFKTSDILKAGLTTLSNGRLLETGGMFFLNAYSQGEKLKLAKGKKILAEIPNINPREGMMLFDGVTKKDGSINWVNPKPFEKDLITYDITTLDFYPEGYIEELKYEYKTIHPCKGCDDSRLVKTNINTNDKQFTDSLYYSYARLFDERKESSELGVSFQSEAVKIDNKSVNRINELYSQNWKDTNVASFADSNDTFQSDTTSYKSCKPKGINPARIKTIWNKKFNNTILATKEFETRLQVIHQAHNDALLNVYVSNITKPLWYCDSVASTIAGSYSSKFKAFYKQKKGGVKVKDRLANRLSSYYERKQKSYSEKAAKSYNKFQKKAQKLRNNFRTKKTKKDRDEFNSKMKVYKEELAINMNEAYRQLGKKKSTFRGALIGAVTTLGAKNVDRYVRESTKNRRTLDYTYPVTGKKAVIKYEQASVKVLNNEKFDRVFVYMVPDSLSSFNRMKTTDNINFKNTLNELFNYKMICLAYKGDQAYFYEGKLLPKHYDVSLTKISEGKLKRKLNKNKGTIKRDVVSDVNFYKEETKFNKANNKIIEAEELTLRIGKFLFPSLVEECIICVK